MVIDGLLNAARKAFGETAPGKLESLSVQKLQSYCQDISKVYPHMDALWKGQYAKRIESIRQEIEIRRIEDRHREVSWIGRKTLTWAIIGGVTGILILGIEGFSLIRDTFFSRAQPSTLPQPSPTPPLQSLSTTSVSPAPEATASTSTPSPQQMLSKTPSPTGQASP